MKRTNSTGTLLVFISAIGFGSKAIFAKIIYQEGVEPFTLIIMRIFLVALFLSITLFVREGKKGFLIPAKLLKDIFRITTFGILVSFVCSYYSLSLLDASIATLIVFTYPSVTILFLAKYGQKISLQKVIALAITYVGLAILLNIFNFDAKRINLLGVMFALITSVGFGYYNANSQRIMKEISPIVFTTTSSVIIAMLLSPGVFFIEWNISVKAYLTICSLSFFTGYISMLCFFTGISKIGADRAVIINSMGPLFTVLMAVNFLGEKLVALQVLGMLTIILGVLFMKFPRPWQKISLKTHLPEVVSKK